MVSPKVIDECLAKLGMLRFFPTSDRVVVQIAKFIAELCKTDLEAKRLIASVVAQHAEWPGPAAIKDIYWSMTHPVKPFSIED
jgi:hypothetical protein